MDVFDKIKQIKIEEVITLLGIQFTRTWGVLCLWEWWSETNGWKASLKENIVSDFNTAKQRASGNPFDFVKRYNNFSDKETVDWFEQYFKIENNSPPPMQQEYETENYKQIVERITKKWQSLWPLTEPLIEYLAKRSINYDKIKDFCKNNNGRISSPITNITGDYITLQSRNPDPTAEHRFRIEKDTLSKWVFIHDIDTDDKRIIVVEWLFDWYTLRQYYRNVVGLKSANDWIEFVEEMAKSEYEIYFVPDNDEAWRSVLEKFKEIDYHMFDLGTYASRDDWVKDINDFATLSGYWSLIIEQIFEDSTYMPSKIKKDYEIKSYESLLTEWLDELLNFDVSKAISWGFSSLDAKLWYILWWELIVVWWLTGSGKSTFVNSVSNNVSLQGFKVWRFTLEDRQQSKRKDELYYAVWKIRKRRWLKNYPKFQFMVNDISDKELFKQELEQARKELVVQNKNILDVVNNTTSVMHISKMEGLVQDFVKKWCKLIIIDHLHYFKFDVEKKERKDEVLEQIMQTINWFCRVYNIAIILVAHYKKIWGMKPDDESFKDAMAIAQVPNKIIHVHRNKMEVDSLTELIITKNREGFTGTIEMNYDTDTWNYTNIKSDLQIKRESK